MYWSRLVNHARAAGPSSRTPDKDEEAGREKKINDKNDGNTNATGQVIWRHAFLDKKKGNQLARNE